MGRNSEVVLKIQIFKRISVNLCCLWIKKRLQGWSALGSDCGNFAETRAEETNKAYGHKYSVAEQNSSGCLRAIEQISCHGCDSNHSST